MAGTSTACLGLGVLTAKCCICLHVLCYFARMKFHADALLTLRKTSLVFRCRDCLGSGTGWTGMGRLNGSGHLKDALD